MGISQTEPSERTDNKTLLERERELGSIAQAIARAREGEGGALLIEGSAGIGKTALMRWAANQAAGEGLQVLRATGREMERGFAFGVIRQLFEPALAKLDETERDEALSGAASPVKALMGAAPAGPPLPDQAFAIVHGLYWLSVNLAERTPLVLLVDDVQWGDPPSIQALAYLAPRAHELPLLVVMARRTGEPAADQLEWLRPAPHLEILRPRALTSAASVALVRALVGAHASDALCDACHEVTGGNPFLVRELAQTIRQEGLDRDDEQGAERIARLAPEGVSQATLARIQALDPNARQLAQALGVLERSELRHAAELAELGEPAAAEAAAALTEAGVLAPELPLRFAHPLLRTAVYSDLPAPTRELAHRRAASLLAEAGAEADLVASHLLESEPRHDEWAVAALRDAARQALARGAPPIAGRLLKRALAESPQHPDRSELLLERAQTYLLGGHAGAPAAFKEVVELSPDPLIRADALAGLAALSAVFGEVAVASELARQGLDEIAGRKAPEIEVRLLFAYTMSAYGNPAVGDELATALELLSPSGSSPADSARAAGLAWNLALRGESRERVAELARRGLADDRLLGLTFEAFFTMSFAAMALANVGHVDEALLGLEGMLVVARERGSVPLRSGVADILALCRWAEQGLIPEALAEIDVLEAAPQQWQGTAAFGHVLHCDVLIDKGDLAGSAKCMERAEEILGRSKQFTQHYWTPIWHPLARSRLRLCQGNAQGALADALAAGEACNRLSVMAPAFGPWRSRAALAAAELGDLERARELCAEELRLARRSEATRAIGTALRTAGAIERGEEGIEPLREAAEVLAGSPHLLEQAKALVELGSALRRTGRRSEAEGPLREGMDLAHRCGATAVVERAETALRALGARPRRYALSGRESLTPSELRVCELATKGHSNREIAERLFVTRRTVETHLTHAYGKLEIQGREQLEAALAPGLSGASH